VTLAESETDVKLMLRRALVNPTMGSAQRRALIKKMFGETLDGCSGARVARRLVDLASRRGPI
jgi:hypothetical protein